MKHKQPEKYLKMFFLPYKTQLPVLFHVRFTALEELESNLFALVLIQKKKKIQF